LLSDPDVQLPQFANNYYYDYKRLAELIQGLEEGPVLVLSRYGPHDRFATLAVSAIAKEIRYPFPVPLCSAISTQYYFALPEFDLIFVPCTEPYRLLGLSDLYHELAHFTAFRCANLLLDPFHTSIDRVFDRMVRDARQKGWVQTLVREMEEHRRRWKTSWLIEFVADMVAAYCAGPAYGWSNVRLCTNLSADLFSHAETHPADEARAAAILLILEKLGFQGEAAEIDNAWGELVGLAGQPKPQGFDLAYPGVLLSQLADGVAKGCRQVGLVAADPKTAYAGNPTTPVTGVVNSAWLRFRQQPEKFAGWEQAALSRLKSQLGV
jgi:hypothetical protein